MTVGGGIIHAGLADPVAGTARVTTWYPELGYRHSWHRDHALLVHLSWLRLRARARPGRIHAVGQGALLGASYEWRWPLARYFQPRLRLGVELSDLRVRDRFTVDQEGFVVERYPARDHRNWNYLMGLSYSLHDYGWANWTISLDWHDPFGLSPGFAGGLRAGARYQLSFD